MDFFDSFEEQTREIVEAAQPSDPSIVAIAGAVLAVDIGSIHTRAVLFDVVDGAYHFVARGQAPTTSGEPWHNVLEGVLAAFQEVETATGRKLLNRGGNLIIPEEDAISGQFGRSNR